MIETYEGILRDNRIEWTGNAPMATPPEKGLRVRVTVLDQVGVGQTRSPGQRMADALERLAALTPLLPELPDPAAWERQLRTDRPLPGREPWIATSSSTPRSRSMRTCEH